MNISMCPDRTTCYNEAMIEELREQLARATVGIPCEAIQAVLDCVGCDDCDASETVQRWLDAVKPVTEVTP